jgi:hypothetical protein
MYKNNKGSTILIVSIIIGVLVLSIGGYFGYTWYQDKLLKERIAKLEKVEDSLSKLESSYNDFMSGSFNPNNISQYKSDTKKIQDNNADLEKLELDKEIEKDVKKCIEDSKVVTDSANKLWTLLEEVVESGTVTNAQRERADQIEKDVKKYTTDKSCMEAQKKVKDLIKELKK